MMRNEYRYVMMLLLIIKLLTNYSSKKTGMKTDCETKIKTNNTDNT